MKIEEPEEYSELTCDGGNEISASEDETVTITAKELEDNMKKQIINNITEFKTMDESEIIDLFCDINGLGEGLVPIEKFDMRTYTASWYRRKFPNFPPQFYELMEKASQEKIANFTMDGKKEGMIKINEEQTISFGGTSNEPGSGSEDAADLDAPPLVGDEKIPKGDFLQISDLSDLKPPELVRSKN